MSGGRYRTKNLLIESKILSAGGGKQEFCRTDFGSRLLAAESEGEEG